MKRISSLTLSSLTTLFWRVLLLLSVVYVASYWRLFWPQRSRPTPLKHTTTLRKELREAHIYVSRWENKSFVKIWRVWHILKVCHALWYLKIEMGIAGSIFELHPPNFQKMCIFWRFTNDICTIFCYLLWFQFWKKCQSLPVHPRVVPDVFYTGALCTKTLDANSDI